MKARALMKLRRPKDALTELEALKDIAPDESMVHFMLGRLYKMIGDKTSAIRHLTIALNLDPKVWICLTIYASRILTLCYHRHLRI
jgi:anaphase-promoting complex subunit 3